MGVGERREVRVGERKRKRDRDIKRERGRKREIDGEIASRVLELKSRCLRSLQRKAGCRQMCVRESVRDLHLCVCACESV